MKENEIKNAFDKIKLSKEKANLIANSIIENREIRTGRKINLTIWKRTAEVCLLVILSVLVVVTPLVFRPGQEKEGNSTKSVNQAALTNESSNVSSKIPDKITKEYIINKIISEGNYYNSIAGKIEYKYINQSLTERNEYIDRSSTAEFQYNNKTSEFYEKTIGTIGTNDVDQETYCDGNKTTIYNNKEKIFRIHNFTMIDKFDLHNDYLEVDNSEVLTTVPWFKSPKTDLQDLFKNTNWIISEKMMYLNRECVKLSSSAVKDKLGNVNMVYYVDLQTGILLYYEAHNDTGAINECIKFTELSFDDNIKVKSVNDAGSKYEGYRELMIIKRSADDTMIAKQTVGNLEFTMAFNNLNYVKGDKIIINTTVKNIGSEPIPVQAGTGSFGIQGCLGTSVYFNGKSVDLEGVKKLFTADMYYDKLDPGKTISRNDVYYTALLNDEVEVNYLEIRATLGIGKDNSESKTVTAKIMYAPYSFNDRFDKELKKTVDSLNADENLKKILLFEKNESVIYVTIDFPTKKVKSNFLISLLKDTQVDISKNNFSDEEKAVIIGLPKIKIVDILKNYTEYKMQFYGTK